MPTLFLLLILARDLNIKNSFGKPVIKMSVLLETSLGDIVIDLLTAYTPKNCEK